MANTFLTSDFVVQATKLAAMLVSKNLVAASLINRDIENDVTSESGGVVNVKVRPTLTANIDEDNKGQTTLAIEDNTQEKVPVDATKYIYHKQRIVTHERTFSLGNFQRDVLEPQALALAHKIDDFLVGRIAGGFARNLVGTPGTAPATTAHILAGRKKYVDNDGPLTARLVSIIGSQAETNFLGLDEFKNRDYGEDNAPALRRARLNPLHGVEFYMDQHAGTFDQGDIAGTVLVNGGSQTGSTLAVDGFTAATGKVRQGTRFTVAGITGTTFTVTEDATIASNAATLSITPALPSSPADNGAITFETAFTEDVIYSPDAVAGAIIAPPALMNGMSSTYRFRDISVRLTFDSGTDGANGANDTVLMDCFVGCNVIRSHMGLVYQG